ncbi:hypothetical protein [Streptomyces beihaiensis]|uniref:Uncharacterized protein n=1 Tax=Streptomyces beihaiensis TaxID=2984495 RepID=A0ABT3U4E4_9ACTN|nr:hypothetical protein [Streptomyces beihaiensis]MCX3064202.1 hypothetical protein [Streptomyces beihaiensis]
MRLRDARDQVEREHPELTGQAKLEAIKALQKSASADAAHCAHCDQDVKPVEKRGWSGVLAWLALLQAAGVVGAIVAAIHPYTVPGAWVGKLALWPAAVHPTWLSIIAAIAAFITAAAWAGSASRRATATATCPKCGLTLAAPA